MATMIAGGFETFGGLPLLAPVAQPVVKTNSRKAGRPWNRLVDRISSGICENAVKHHRTEHQRLASQAAAELQFREKIADLKARILCKSSTPFPPVTVDA